MAGQLLLIKPSPTYSNIKKYSCSIIKSASDLMAQYSSFLFSSLNNLRNYLISYMNFVLQFEGLILDVLNYQGVVKVE